MVPNNMDASGPTPRSDLSVAKMWLEGAMSAATDPYTPSNAIFKPSAGDRWLAIDLTVKTTSSQKITFSTLLYMELKDSESKAWTASPKGEVADPNQPRLDGDVAAGDSRRVTAVFEVPESATGLTLRVKGGFTANGAVWQLP